jgi:hypothetical protein
VSPADVPGASKTMRSRPGCVASELCIDPHVSADSCDEQQWQALTVARDGQGHPAAPAAVGTPFGDQFAST